MLSETDRDSLSDILFNIDLANSFAAGFDYARFLADMRTFYAITGCLEIISEASRRLSPEIKVRHPDIPWRKVSGSGNVYRHDYEDVAHRLVWGTWMSFCRSCGLWSKPSSQSKPIGLNIYEQWLERIRVANRNSVACAHTYNELCCFGAGVTIRSRS